jgi:hypothetical protein
MKKKQSYFDKITICQGKKKFVKKVTFVCNIQKKKLLNF